MRRRVLYFIKSAMPTEANKTKAGRFGPDTVVCFRNVTMYKEGDTLEQCDGVCGFPPKAYVDKFGTATPNTEAEQANGTSSVENSKEEGTGTKQGSESTTQKPVDSTPAPAKKAAAKQTKEKE